MKPWENDDETTFPINYKAEFLLHFFTEFYNNFAYTRVSKTQSLLKDLYERNPENSLVAKNYIITILKGVYDGLSYSGDVPTPYFEKAEEIQKKYEFNEEDLQYLEFLRLITLLKFTKTKNLNEAHDIYKKILEISKEMKSLYLVSIISFHFRAFVSRKLGLIKKEMNDLEDYLLEELKDSPDSVNSLSLRNLYF